MKKTTRDQPLRLVIVVSGGVIQGIGVDAGDGKVPTIQARVIDYDTPSGLTVVNVPQSDGGTSEASTYAVRVASDERLKAVLDGLESGLWTAARRSGEREPDASMTFVDRETGEIEEFAAEDPEQALELVTLPMPSPAAMKDLPRDDLPPIGLYQDDLLRAA